MEPRDKPPFPNWDSWCFYFQGQVFLIVLFSWNIFLKGKQNVQKSKLRKAKERDGWVQDDNDSKLFILLGFYVQLHLNIKMNEENTRRVLYFV